MPRSIFFIVVLTLGLVEPVQAGVMYSFSGVLSAGSSNHSGILDGESWKATFVIDDTITDTDASVNFGEYPNSVRSASIAFSGGFTKQFVYQPGFGVSVLDNANFGVEYDAVGAFLENGAASLNSSILSLDTSVLTSDAIPGAGTSFISDLGTLDFVDDNGEFVSFVSSARGDVSFTASVPEPGTFASMMLLVVVGISRRRQQMKGKSKEK